MMFGALGGTAAGNPDHDECVRIIHAALDAGINVLDTADMYSAGESEQIVGQALRGRRDDVVLATKCHFPLDEGRGHSGNSRRWILRAVEDSLRRLRTDWIDLYQIHRPDESTDIEETLSALSDLVHQGKIRAFGTSSFPAHHLVDAHAVADRRGLLRPRTEQPPYSLLGRGIERGIERDVLPLCQRHRTGVLTWSPLAFGFLSGRYRRGGAVRPPPAPRHRSTVASGTTACSHDGRLHVHAVPQPHRSGCDLPETCTGALYLDKIPQRKPYRQMWRDIDTRALGSDASRDMITETAKEYGS